MINLNIIPENLKSEVRIRKFYDLLKNFLSVILIILISFLIIFLLFKLLLSRKFVTTVNETTVSTRNTENFGREVIELNNNINSAKNIQKDFITWSAVLDFIRNSQKDEITIDRIVIDKEKKSINLGGLAATRDSLLVFKDKLEKSEYFEKIDLPIANLLKKENISLDIKLIFKTYEFK